jgi:predicted ribosomally synthesized peptide with nif11-like leader
MKQMEELYRKVADDTVLQAKLATAMKDADKVGEYAAKQNLTAFAKDAGYDIKMEEMQAFFKDLAEKETEELSDAELDMVAGGKSQGYLVASIMSIGFACAIASIIGSTSNKSCDSVVDEQMDMQV